MNFSSIDGLSTGTLALLAGSLVIALGFEFVNGFHDTANAVATVIYTRTLKPRWAVIWSGFCNFCGVYLGGTAVAFAVVNLLPVEMLLDVGSGRGLAMVFALLIAAIAWNLGTWWLGLPASSSHTLIGAILGVGLVHSAMEGHPGQGVNWAKAGEVGLSLLISPVVGFVAAGGLLLVLKRAIKDPELFEPAPADKPPPGWIRGVLLVTCSGVSFAHGSNDGQKGIGLIMLILIGVVPAHYLIDLDSGPAALRRAAESAGRIEKRLEILGKSAQVDRLRSELGDIGKRLASMESPRDLPVPSRRQLRDDLVRIRKQVSDLEHHRPPVFDRKGREAVRSDRATMERLVEYAPTWVLIAVATALGLGTTVGWKRIVETVGEKIGKSHLSYAQGASAEVVAMLTIGLADLGGLPVSTTHVLSSGVAGTMTASGSGLQLATVRNIALAWLLTLPAAMLMAGGLFAAFRAMGW